MIIESPSLKDSSGKEVQRFHDTTQQHLRALKAMGHEPSGEFITSLLELKLDSDTMFEWQKHRQDSTEVPHYSKLLEFINLRAQASESSATELGKKGTKNEVKFPRKSGKPSIFSHPVSTDVASANCVACKTEKHPCMLVQRSEISITSKSYQCSVRTGCA